MNPLSDREEKIIELSIKDQIPEVGEKLAQMKQDGTEFEIRLLKAENSFLSKCLRDELDRGTELIRKFLNEGFWMGVFVGLMSGIIGMGFYITFYLPTVK